MCTIYISSIYFFLFSRFFPFVLSLFFRFMFNCKRLVRLLPVYCYFFSLIFLNCFFSFQIETLAFSLFFSLRFCLIFFLFFSFFSSFVLFSSSYFINSFCEAKKLISIPSNIVGNSKLEFFLKSDFVRF